MYKLSTRQLLLLAVLPTAMTLCSVVAVYRVADRLQPVASAASDSSAGLPGPLDERNNIEVYKSVAPGVVFITSTSEGHDMFDSGERQGAGSGLVIDEQGHILTNDHVVAGAERLMVSLGGDKRYPARIVGRDPDTDIAVLQISAPRDQLKVVPLGDSDTLEIGQKVLAIGNPFGLDRTLTSGIISGLQRPIRARNGRLIEGAIQTDASINPGNSGGPLLDSSGRMIGINSQILSPAGGWVGVGFAIPVNIVKHIVPELLRNGHVSRPKLGVATRNVKDLGAHLSLPVATGVIIVQVARDGSAAAAGLGGLEETEDGGYVLGDIITAIDGTKVNDGDELVRLLDKHQVGDVVQIEIMRAGKRTTVPVKLLAERATGSRTTGTPEEKWGSGNRKD